MNIPELLAPAGNAVALHAAVTAGADAVYLGLESFNARRGADNFTLDSLADACAYAHARGVRVYVALNTIVLPDEVPSALECARQAHRIGADALIVQDLGLADEIARTLPAARLHFSTQMNIHNEAGIRAAARLGARRVTLARELSLGEIAHLSAVAADLGVEVETFVHGALCVCYSGQCLMSSMIGGRSANRGMCAQACRLPYTLCSGDQAQVELPAAGEHLLSPQDLCAHGLLDDLAQAGVASLKIEGRMKSPEYVAGVTGVYRTALERLAQDVEPDPEVEECEREELAAVFSRGFTTAYMEGRRDNDIMSYQRPNNRGQFVGRVKAVRGERVVVAATCDLVDGDVVEFWTKRGHAALAVRGLERDGSGLFSMPLDGRVRPPLAGDRVFRVRSAEASFDDDALEPRIPVEGSVKLRIGEPLRMEFRVADPTELTGCDDDDAAAADRIAFQRRMLGRIAGYRGDVPAVRVEGDIVEAARTKAVSAEEVRAHVDRLGSTPFALVRLSVELDADAGIGFSQIHRLRSRALDALLDALLDGTVQRGLPRASAREIRSAAPPSRPIVAALVASPDGARVARKAGAKAIYVSVLNSVSAGEMTAGCARVPRADAFAPSRYPDGCLFVMPVVDHDACGLSREARLGWDVWRDIAGHAPLMVDSLGGMQRAAEAGIPFEVGPHVPLTNALSLDVACDFGAQRIWLSPELTLAQIRDLGEATPVELGIVVSGAQELMVTEHCLLMSQGFCDQQCALCARRRERHFLRDRLDFEFPVATDVLGRGHLYNSVPLDTVFALADLLTAGVRAFLVDATLLDAEQTDTAVRRAVRALNVARSEGASVDKLADTTAGHLFRGVS